MSPRSRIAVLYNDDHGLWAGARDRAAVEGVRDAAEAVAAALSSLGHEPILIAVGPEPAELIAALRSHRPELVFNLIESVRGESRLESAAAWLLEWLGIPFTGNAPEVLSLGLDKGVSKTLLEARGVPVPAGVVLLDGSEPFEHLRAPWIVKPLCLDASHGIDRDSVSSDPGAIRAKAQELRNEYRQSALVEELATGRELNVSILGTGEAATPLPPGEIDFSQFPPGRPPILTYEAKWQEDSPDYLGTPAIAARSLEPELQAKIYQVALDAYRALGLRDYGRVDLRLDLERGPLVLEVNPNPDLSPGAGLARAAERGGSSYEQLVARILTEARARAPAAPRS